MEVRCPRCNRINYRDKNHFCTGCDEPLFMHRELLGEFAREHFSASVEPSRSSLPQEGAWHFVSLCPVLDEGGYQWLPLHWAVFFNQREIAELLLASGIEVNAPSGTGDIPLHMARSPGMARLLISKGASVNARNQRGETPLFVALRFGKNDLITLLIHHGASVNARDNHGSTPLHRTAREGAREMAELLLLFGADVNARDNEGRAPLHLVESKGVAAILIAYGAEVNARDSNGWTPLGVTFVREKVFAKNKSLSEVIELLLCRGAEE